MNSLFLVFIALCVLTVSVLYILGYFTFLNKKIGVTNWLFILIGILLLTNFLVLISKGLEVNNKLNLVIKAPNEFVSTIKRDSTISDAKLYQYLLKTRVGNPEIIFCQAKHESSSYTSPLFLRASNLFGMKISGSRVCVGGAESGEFQKYDGGWKESVTDYIIYGFENNLNNLNQTEYIKFLSSGVYGKDPQYSNKILKMLKETNFKKLENGK